MTPASRTYLSIILFNFITYISISTAQPPGCIGTCYSDFRMLGKHLDEIEKDTSLAYCWQSTILIHCLGECNGKQDMRMDKTRSSRTDEPSLHIGWAQCTVNNERYIADHCHQQVGLVEANAIAGNAPKTCTWLTDYQACYIANIELYCGFDLGQYLRTHEHLVSLYIYRPFVELMKTHHVDMEIVMECDVMYVAQQILAGQSVVTRTTSTTSTTTTPTTTTTKKTEAIKTTKKLLSDEPRGFVEPYGFVKAHRFVADADTERLTTAEKSAVHVLDERETQESNTSAARLSISFILLLSSIMILVL